MKNIKQLPKDSGIYRVRNKINNASYIGQSINIYKRFNSHHICNYKNPNNENYNTKFYQALRKYGIDNFEVTILELCDKTELDKKEIYYIKIFDSFHHGYNSTEGGQFWSPDMHSEEVEKKRAKTREKNQSLKGQNHPRAKMTNEEVIQVRQRYINGEKISQIYEDYKDRYNSIETFKRIILGYTYKDIGNIPKSSQIRHTNAKLTDIQVKEIRQKYQKGKISYEKLGKEYGVSSTTISRIVKKQIYAYVN